MRGPPAKNFFEYSIGRIIKLNAWSVLMFAAQIRSPKSEIRNQKTQFPIPTNNQPVARTPTRAPKILLKSVHTLAIRERFFYSSFSCKKGVGRKSWEE